MGSPLPTGPSNPRPATPGGRARLPPPPATSSRPVLYGSVSSHAVSILCHHRTSGKRNSTKFKVASNRSDAAVSTRQQHAGTPLASKLSDLVAVVAPTGIKGLRLV